MNKGNPFDRRKYANSYTRSRIYGPPFDGCGYPYGEWVFSLCSPKRDSADETCIGRGRDLLKVTLRIAVRQHAFRLAVESQTGSTAFFLRLD